MNGVFPVNDVAFEISTTGRDITGTSMTAISGMESMTVSFDNGVNEWNPIDDGGWARRLVTSKSITVSLSGKRVVGCAGNDYVAQAAFGVGAGALTVLAIFFPNGDLLKLECVLSVTACGGGSGGDIAVLEFDCLSDGRPIFMRADGTVVN